MADYIRGQVYEKNLSIAGGSLALIIDVDACRYLNISDEERKAAIEGEKPVVVKIKADWSEKHGKPFMGFGLPFEKEKEERKKKTD